MDNSENNAGITRVGVVGTGVIGASWAAYFLAHGLDVMATDPADGAEARLRADVARFWPTLERAGLPEGASQDRLSFTPDLAAALENVQLVQENGPERIDFKIELYRQMDAATAQDVILASSSSTLPVSRMQSACAHPERVVLAHPFNPPHVVPLVEIGGGNHTADWAIDKAFDFYAAIGRKPIRVRQEVFGHIANRLQAALWQEAYSLVERGIATVADVDTAIAWGPGMRWAMAGPFLNQHFSGGAGGIAHVLAHLGPPTEAIFRDLQDVHLSPELCAKIVAQTDEMIGDADAAEVERNRDALIVDLAKRKAGVKLVP